MGYGKPMLGLTTLSILDDFWFCAFYYSRERPHIYKGGLPSIYIYTYTQLQCLFETMPEWVWREHLPENPNKLLPKKRNRLSGWSHVLKPYGPREATVSWGCCPSPEWSILSWRSIWTWWSRSDPVIWSDDRIGGFFRWSGVEVRPVPSRLMMMASMKRFSSSISWGGTRDTR